MYNALTPRFNNVTPTDLVNDFKPEPVGIKGAAPPVTLETGVPHAGVTIYRDAFDVPYIYGTTRDDDTQPLVYTAPGQVAVAEPTGVPARPQSTVDTRKLPSAPEPTIPARRVSWPDKCVRGPSCHWTS